MKRYFALMIMIGTGSAGAAADKSQTVMNDPLGKLIECRGIGTGDQRLACYDQQVESLDNAQKRKDIVVVSKTQVKEARKSLFGFTLPNLSLFTGGAPGASGEKAEEVLRLDSMIASASPISDGNWSIRLVSGGTWETQSDLTFPPRSGDKVVINRAAFGSFLAQIGANRGVRMRRVG